MNNTRKVKFGKFSPAKIDIRNDNECWPWKRALNKWGYGITAWNGKQTNASRASYEYFVGPVPDGMVVCHRCDYPACCNPNHLFIGSQAENLKDCRDKGRMVYLRGASHHRSTAKLTEQMVLEARHRYFNNGESQSAIARDFGVNSGTISRAVRGKLWSHLQ